MGERVEVEVVKLRKRTSGSGHVTYEITIPRSFIEKLGWEPGTKLLLKLEGSKIIVEKPE